MVSLPAVETGLCLDERVVRRHAAKLEAAGWLGRAPWVWGEGSVVWLTSLGLQGAGLGGLRAVKAPPRPMTIAHGVLVGFSAARIQRRGLRWRSARELALEPERWAVRMRDERGHRYQLPDLAAQPKDSRRYVAVIAEAGHRREDRQRMILEGWRDAISSGQYAAVRYDCASASVARRITHLGKKVQLTAPSFLAAAQTTAEEIAAIVAAPETDAASTEESPAAEIDDRDETQQVRGVEPCPVSPPPATPMTNSDIPPWTPEPESPEERAEREREYREVMGIPEEKPGRRWRR